MSQIYPTLKKMESEGLVISLIESSPIGPDRKIYTRTNEGKRVLYTGDEPMEATIFKKVIQKVYFSQKHLSYILLPILK